MTIPFKAYSWYYDLLYQDKKYAEEAAYIQTTLSRLGVTQGNLLEFGSGTGKHGRLLAKQGFQVHGIERSGEMVAQSSQGDGFTCQEDDICTAQVADKFDAVLSLFHVVSYQTSNTDLVAVCANAAAHLKPNGLFIFDFWYSPAVYAQRPEVRVKRMADAKVEITRLAEPVFHPNDNRVDVNYTIFARDTSSSAVQTLYETHPMRHFSLPEIDILAQLTGYKRLVAEEFLSGKTPGEDTWSVCVVLQKV
jgi:SAM-dependent methyltransferase